MYDHSDLINIALANKSVTTDHRRTLDYLDKLALTLPDDLIG